MLSQLKKQYHELENKTLAQIETNIANSGSARKLSLLVYENETTLASQLARAKQSSPYKLATLLKILEKIEKKALKHDKKRF